MKNLLKQIALPSTEKRAKVIMNFLKRNHYLFRIQKINNSDFNIIVDINEKCKENFEVSDDKLILTAHYDVVPNSTGANDNGSSIVILLKLLKKIKNQPIKVIFFTGEERGGTGSSFYSKTVKEKEKYTAINLDVCGCGNQIVVVNNIKNNNSKAYNLYSRKNKFNIMTAPSFPFSDASILKRYDIATYSISVFPPGDIRILNGEEKGYLGKYIWEYMHNGKYDDIKYINYRIMKKVYKYLKKNIL
jgi:hypothetical protein